MSAAKSIVIVGGHSGIAQEILATYAPNASAFVRHNPQAGSRVVADYHAIVADDLVGADTVIICAGLVTGSLSDLMRANRDLPVSIARAAQAAGVRRLITISSFSVFGNAVQISHDTPTLPLTDYGRSKLEGDRSLMELCDENFIVIPVRFPAIINASTGGGKLGELVRFWHKARVFPIPDADIKRSMITTSLAARTLVNFCNSDISGPRLAADPLPFTYAAAANALARATKLKLRLFRLPRWTFAPLAAVRPKLFDSLYADSLLSPKNNICADGPSDLYNAIGRLAANRATQ